MPLSVTASQSAERSIEIRPDGSVRVGNSDYASWGAYFSSSEFRERGGRCGTEIDWMSAAAATDCSLQQTVPSPSYAPAKAFLVPVVWHVVEAEDGTGAISDERIENQMAVLNEDFRAFPGGPGQEGDDARIQFMLASEDPRGRATDGVNRYRSDDLFADTGDGDMQRALSWDPTRYLNIYTTNAAIGQTPVLGYATLPQGGAGSRGDGVVLHYSVVGRNPPDAYPYDEGRTATHEVGHYFGLLHPFDSGCGDATAPYTTGDLLADTPPEDAPTFVCEASATACDTFPSIDNYMSYTPDACMTKFSAEQILRMRCSALHYRPDLFVTRSLAGIDVETEREGRTVHFRAESRYAGEEVQVWQWDFGDGHSSAAPAPTHTYDESGAYPVTVSVVDEAGLIDVAEAEVVANLPPVASFEAEARDLDIDLVDDSSDPDGEIVSWVWDFGDGHSSTAQHPRHTYAEPGVYTTSLLVVDDLGGSALTEASIDAGARTGCGGCAASGHPPLAGPLLTLAGLAALRRRPA